MKEYTILAIISVIVTVFVDRVSGIRILKRGEFYILLLIIFLFKLLVNDYLTGTEIVLYNPAFFLGLRIGSIPVEDFLFGFSMVTQSVIFWEYFLKR
ncbi:MAG: lycopene cyclase domain-containing protein [Candidatus Omnitrophota bacterium]|nr:MAG: lycopene cyclase domain-containing protein [Candidatus Omnitrophota bacterium]